LKIKEIIKKLFKKKKVYAVYEPFGVIQSSTICKHILNKLIVTMEKEREVLISDMYSADLNDKNSISFFGEIRALTSVLNKVRNLLKNYGVVEEEE
jgi:hypothetical protein